VIAARELAVAVHALLHDGPVALLRDEETVEIELEVERRACLGQRVVLVEEAAIDANDLERSLLEVVGLLAVERGVLRLAGALLADALLAESLVEARFLLAIATVLARKNRGFVLALYDSLPPASATTGTPTSIGTSRGKGTEENRRWHSVRSQSQRESWAWWPW
jgi:hypothetical protein